MCAVVLTSPPQTALIELLRNTLMEVERTTLLPQEGAALAHSLACAIRELQSARVVEICGAHGVPPGSLRSKK